MVPSRRCQTPFPHFSIPSFSSDIIASNLWFFPQNSNPTLFTEQPSTISLRKLRYIICSCIYYDKYMARLYPSMFHFCTIKTNNELPRGMTQPHPPSSTPWIHEQTQTSRRFYALEIHSDPIVTSKHVFSFWFFTKAGCLGKKHVSLFASGPACVEPLTNPSARIMLGPGYFFLRLRICVLERKKQRNCWITSFLLFGIGAQICRCRYFCCFPVFSSFRPALQFLWGRVQHDSDFWPKDINTIFAFRQ